MGPDDPSGISDCGLRHRHLACAGNAPTARPVTFPAASRISASTFPRWSRCAARWRSPTQLSAQNPSGASASRLGSCLCHRDSDSRHRRISARSGFFRRCGGPDRICAPGGVLARQHIGRLPLHQKRQPARTPQLDDSQLRTDAGGGDAPPVLAGESNGRNVDDGGLSCHCVALLDPQPGRCRMVCPLRSRTCDVADRASLDCTP